MPTFKPAGYSTVSPYLLCASAQAVVDFLVATFDAEPLRRHEAPDGRIAHTEVRIGDTVVMLGEPGGEGPLPAAHLHVYVPDVAASWGRALAAGGTPVQEPQRKGDGDLRGGVKGPGGHTWWIATAG